MYRRIINKILYIRNQGLKKNLKKYAVYLMNHYDQEIEKLRKKKRVMVISKGEYDYTFFNICYLNNMLSLMLLAMYKGYIPSFEGEHCEDKIKWNWYFTPPESIWGDISHFKKKKCSDIVSPYAPSFEDLIDLESIDYQFWSFFANKFAKINSSTQSYLREDADGMNFDCDFQHTVGVLLRGTDYTKMKPSGHPIQPDINELCGKINSVVSGNSNIRYIYVATEEKRLCCELKKNFPNLIVLENKRHYIDDQFYSMDCNYVSEVTVGMENENYSRGIEYLSSLLILAKCNFIVSGISGGVVGTMLFRGNPQGCHFIYKGKY